MSWSEVLTPSQLAGDSPAVTDPSWEVVPCQQGWEYIAEQYHVSLTMEQDWVCDQAWIPALSQSLFFIGAIPGMIFFGWFSDTRGRVQAIILSNFICLITAMVTLMVNPLMVNNYVYFFLLRFFQGVAYTSFYSLAFVYGD